MKEDAYPVIPVKSIRDFLTLMAKVRKDLHKITTPILIISSVVDHVVPPENSEIIYNEVSAPDKTIVFLKNSYHVATLDNDKELIVKECCRFIKIGLANLFSFIFEREFFYFQVFLKIAIIELKEITRELIKLGKGMFAKIRLRNTYTIFEKKKICFNEHHP